MCETWEGQTPQDQKVTVRSLPPLEQPVKSGGGEGQIRIFRDPSGCCVEGRLKGDPRGPGRHSRHLCEQRQRGGSVQRPRAWAWRPSLSSSLTL